MLDIGPRKILPVRISGVAFLVMISSQSCGLNPKTLLIHDNHAKTIDVFSPNIYQTNNKLKSDLLATSGEILSNSVSFVRSN